MRLSPSRPRVPKGDEESDRETDSRWFLTAGSGSSFGSPGPPQRNFNQSNAEFLNRHHSVRRRSRRRCRHCRYNRIFIVQKNFPPLFHSETFTPFICLQKINVKSFRL